MQMSKSNEIAMAAELARKLHAHFRNTLSAASQVSTQFESADRAFLEMRDE